MVHAVGKARASRQNYGTPKYLFNQLHSEYQFTIDICAEPWNAKLPRYVTKEQDALSFVWGPDETVWCNPPFKRPAKWLEKGLEAVEYGSKSVFLLPASTDTVWFHDLAMFGQIHLFKGRIAFDTPPGVKNTDNPNVNPMLVIFDPKATTSGHVATRSAKTGKVIWEVQ